MRSPSPALILVLAAGCGSVSSNPDAADTADAPPASDAAALDAEAFANEGIVVIAEQTDPSGTSSTVSVSMADGALFGGPAASAGGCGFYDMPSEAGESAGVVTIAGTLVDVIATPDAMVPVNYGTGTLPTDLFTPGSTLTVTAAGATVPAFTGSVIAPAALAGVALPTAISRAAPPTLRWTAGAGDEMWSWVLGISMGGVSLVWCRMPDTGTFAIPTAALGLIPTTVTSALVILWRTNVTPVRAGAWSVALTAAEATATGSVTIGP